MIGAIGTVDDMGDFALFIDDERHAVGHAQDIQCQPHQATAADGAIGLGYRFIGIGQ